MNILFITTHFNTGGITSYVLTLSEALVKSGHRVWVASSGGNGVERLESMGVQHIPINIRTKSELHPKVWFSIKPLRQLIENEKIEIIHAQTRVTQVLGFFLSRATGIPMVTTCHGFFRPRWFRKIFPCWGEGVIAISKPVKQHLRDDFGVPEGRIHLISNGIDLNRFVMTNAVMRQETRRVWNMTDEMSLIGVIARLSDVKGIDVLIKAMPSIIKKVPSANLLIAGQGPEEAYLKKLVKDLSLNGSIFFKETINQTQELLPAFDVFVMPSLMEGLGLSVIEAQACGIPVVASKVGGLIDLITDGISGHLVPVKDSEALANRIIAVLENSQQARIMSQKARLNVEQYFSVDRMLKETVRIYEQYSHR